MLHQLCFILKAASCMKGADFCKTRCPFHYDQRIDSIQDDVFTALHLTLSCFFSSDDHRWSGVPGLCFLCFIYKSRCWFLALFPLKYEFSWKKTPFCTVMVYIMYKLQRGDVYCTELLNPSNYFYDRSVKVLTIQGISFFFVTSGRLVEGYFHL